MNEQGVFYYQVLHFFLDLTIERKVPVGFLYTGDAGKPILRTFVDHVPPSHRELVTAALASTNITALPASLDEAPIVNDTTVFFAWSEPTRALMPSARAKYAEELQAFFVGRAPKFCECGGER
jgi:hypothetical protein